MYEELVHRPYKGFMQFDAWELKNGSYKILIPKGTTSWNTGITTYKYPEEAGENLDLLCLKMRLRICTKF